MPLIISKQLNVSFIGVDICSVWHLIYDAKVYGAGSGKSGGNAWPYRCMTHGYKIIGWENTII